MKFKPKNNEFKAVEFMREQRDRLTKLYQSDKVQFHKELEQSTKRFLERRQSKSGNKKAREISK